MKVHGKSYDRWAATVFTVERNRNRWLVERTSIIPGDGRKRGKTGVWKNKEVKLTVIGKINEVQKGEESFLS